MEGIRRASRREREAALRQAGLNVFNIPADKVFIDLLSDSGTSAMNDNQWSGWMVGDESYAGAKNFFTLEKTVRHIYVAEALAGLYKKRDQVRGLKIVFQPPQLRHFTARLRKSRAASSGLRSALLGRPFS